jgi:hypothetical protein
MCSPSFQPKIHLQLVWKLVEENNRPRSARNAMIIIVSMQVLGNEELFQGRHGSSCCFESVQSLVLAQILEVKSPSSTSAMTWSTAIGWMLSTSVLDIETRNWVIRGCMSISKYKVSSEKLNTMLGLCRMLPKQRGYDLMTAFRESGHALIATGVFAVE